MGRRDQVMGWRKRVLRETGIGAHFRDEVQWKLPRIHGPYPSIFYNQARLPGQGLRHHPSLSNLSCLPDVPRER